MHPSSALRLIIRFLRDSNFASVAAYVTLRQVPRNLLRPAIRFSPRALRQTAIVSIFSSITLKIHLSWPTGDSLYGN